MKKGGAIPRGNRGTALKGNATRYFGDNSARGKGANVERGHESKCKPTKAK